jgi:hypothetical protein
MAGLSGGRPGTHCINELSGPAILLPLFNALNFRCGRGAQNPGRAAYMYFDGYRVWVRGHSSSAAIASYSRGNRFSTRSSNANPKSHWVLCCRVGTGRA